MKKSTFWLGLIILVASISLFFSVESVDDRYWAFLGLVGFIVIIFGAIQKPNSKIGKKGVFKRKRGKRGALEMSIGTIVIIVLAMTMLILGMVLVRSIVCGAVDLVLITEGNVKGEIDKLFQSTGGEIVCLGGGEKSVTLVAGEYNTVYCAINAPKVAEYEIKTKSIKGDVLTETQLKSWVSGDDFLKASVSPGDELPKKFLRLNVPENAPKDLIVVNVEIYKDGTLISTQQLDFEVRSVGAFTVAVC